MDIEWKNFSLQCDPELINNNTLADIKFQFTDEKEILAHSFVLCLRNQEFFNNFKNSIGVMKLIYVDNVSYGAFLEFIRYLYTDKITLQSKCVRELMILADQYNVIELKEKLKQFVLKN